MQATNDIAFDMNPKDLLRIQLCIHDIVTRIIEGNEYQCQRDINSLSNYAIDCDYAKDCDCGVGYLLSSSSHSHLTETVFW